MKKTYDLPRLRQLAGTLQERVSTARATYALLDSELKELDSPTSKKAYKPEHLLQLKTEKRQTAAKRIRHLLGEMRQFGAPALAEKRRWSKEALVREARFATMPENTFTKDDRLLAAVYALTDSVNRLQTTTWLQRLDDDALAEAASDAADSGDIATVGAALSESRLQSRALVDLMTHKALEKVELPEAAEAASLFDDMDKAL